MFDTTIFLQAGAPSAFANMIPFILIIIVFWFFIIRPQSKKQKEQQNFTNDIQKGDDVVTASGMLGKINKIDNDIITLEVGNKTYIRVTRGAISKELTEAVYKDDDKKVGIVRD